MIRMTLFALLAGMVAVAPALAGSAVIGSVAGSMNASIGGQALLPNTTIFSGDSLQVKDGVAVIAVGNNSRVIFGRDTVASFLRDNNAVTVVLSQGNVSLLHASEGTPVRVKAGEVAVTAAGGFKTLGEVAMLNGSVVISAKEGSLQVENHRATKHVDKGQTIVIAPKTAKGGGGAGWGGGGSTGLEVASVGAGATAAVLGGVAMSRAGDANSAANDATSTAAAAASAANAAASAASAAAAAAAQAAFLAACANDYAQTHNYASVDAMYGGSQCPTYGVSSSTTP
jgi:hypothetical protein